MSITRFLPSILCIFISFVFIQSLFFKFADAEETQHIFNTLDGWAATGGFRGLFSATGLFSQYVIGTAELGASVLLLLSLIKRDWIGARVMGAAIALAIISAAIFFHLFTPLGVQVQGDGGTLFVMAGGVWLSAALLLVLHRKTVVPTLCRLASALTAGPSV